MFYIYDILKSFRYALFKKLVYDYKKIRITCSKIAITYKLYFNNLNGVGDRVNKRVYDLDVHELLLTVCILNLSTVHYIY